MSRVEQFQEVGSGHELIFLVQFSLGQFYVAKTRSKGRIVSGQTVERFNNHFR